MIGILLGLLHETAARCTVFGIFLCTFFIFRTFSVHEILVNAKLQSVVPDDQQMLDFVGHHFDFTRRLFDFSLQFFQPIFHLARRIASESAEYVPTLYKTQKILFIYIYISHIQLSDIQLYSIAIVSIGWSTHKCIRQIYYFLMYFSNATFTSTSLQFHINNHDII